MEVPDEQVFAVHTALPAGQTALTKNVKKIHFRGLNRLDAQFYESIVLPEEPKKTSESGKSTGKQKSDRCNSESHDRCSEGDT